MGLERKLEEFDKSYTRELYRKTYTIPLAVRRFIKTLKLCFGEEKLNKKALKRIEEKLDEIDMLDNLLHYEKDVKYYDKARKIEKEFFKYSRGDKATVWREAKLRIFLLKRLLPKNMINQEKLKEMKNTIIKLKKMEKEYEELRLKVYEEYRKKFPYLDDVELQEMVESDERVHNAYWKPYPIELKVFGITRGLLLSPDTLKEFDLKIINELIVGGVL